MIAALLTLHIAALCYALALAAALIADEIADRRTRRANAHRLTSGGTIR